MNMMQSSGRSQVQLAPHPQQQINETSTTADYDPAAATADDNATTAHTAAAASATAAALEPTAHCAVA